jgi:alpha-beta hydrolase superfamily lysophospholipase
VKSDIKNPRGRWNRVLGRAAWFLAGALLAVVGLYIGVALNRPQLSPWHDFAPDGEFRARSAARVQSFDDYLELEERLFDDLRRWDPENGTATGRLSRFNPDSPTNPLEYDVNGNRTFVLDSEEIRGGALLLHGLSDSPYSVAALGRILQSEGYLVIGLRLPGHGTVPGALQEVVWRDWRAAVSIAARSLRRRVGDDVPLILGGYCNGDALALDYTVRSLDDPDLPRPDKLIFFSPALAVSRLAALARWQRWASYLPGLSKLGWNSLVLEYDPYKYNSFSLNAAEQIYRLTRALDGELSALQKAGRIGELPPVLTFQSAVDATVPPLHSLRRLYGRIESNGSEIVIFDVNREAQLEMFLNTGVNQLIDVLYGTGAVSYQVTLLTNATEESPDLVARHRPVGVNHWLEEPLDLTWPRSIYSLSHVALPFPPDDPIYGAGPEIVDPFPLGNVEPRGERGALAVPMTLLMRLRYNPFFGYVERRVVEFVRRPTD